MTDRLSGCGCCGCFNRELQLSPDFYFPAATCIVTEDDELETAATPVTVTETYANGVLSSITSVDGATSTVQSTASREYIDSIPAAGTFRFVYPETSSVTKGRPTIIGDRSSGNYQTERVDTRTTSNLTRDIRRRLVLTFNVADQSGFGIIDANGIPLITASHVKFTFSRWNPSDWVGTNSTQTQFSVMGFLRDADPAITTSVQFDAATASHSQATSAPAMSAQYMDVTNWLPGSSQNTIRLLVDETRGLNRGAIFSEVKLGISEQYVARAASTTTTTELPVARKAIRQGTSMIVRRVYSGEKDGVTPANSFSTLVSDTNETITTISPSLQLSASSEVRRTIGAITSVTYDYVETPNGPPLPDTINLDTEFTFPFEVTSSYGSALFDLRYLQSLPSNQTLVDVKFRVQSNREPVRFSSWPVDVRGPVQSSTMPTQIADLESLSLSAPARTHSFDTPVSEFDITANVLAATEPLFFSVDARDAYTRPDLSGNHPDPINKFPANSSATTAITAQEIINQLFPINLENAFASLSIITRINVFPDRDTAYMDGQADWKKLLAPIGGSLYEFRKRLPKDRFDITVTFGSTRDYDSFWLVGARVDFSLVDATTLASWLEFHVIVQSAVEQGVTILRMMLHTPNGTKSLASSGDPFFTRNMDAEIYLRVFEDFVQFGENDDYTIDVTKSVGRPRNLRLRVDFNSTANDSRPQLNLVVREWADPLNDKKEACTFLPWCQHVWPYTRLKGFSIEEVVNTTAYSFRGNSVTELSEPCVPEVARDPGQIKSTVTTVPGYALADQLDDDTLYTTGCVFRIGEPFNYFIKPGEVFAIGNLVFIETTTKLVTPQTNNGLNGFLGTVAAFNVGGNAVFIGGPSVIDMIGSGFSQLDVGSDVFADGQTLTLSSSNTTFIGKVVGYVSPMLLKVRIQPTAVLLSGQIGVSCFKNDYLYPGFGGIGRLYALGKTMPFEQLVNIRDAGTAWATDPIDFDVREFVYNPTIGGAFPNFLELLGGGLLSVRIRYTPDLIYT